MNNQQYMELLGLTAKVTDQRIADSKTSSELRAELVKFKESIVNVCEAVLTNGKGKISHEEFNDSGPFNISDYPNLTSGSPV